LMVSATDLSRTSSCMVLYLLSCKQQAVSSGLTAFRPFLRGGVLAGFFHGGAKLLPY